MIESTLPPGKRVGILTVNGAALRTGDLYASGTVSGPERDQRGTLIELTWNGSEPLTLPDGTSRAWLEDSDELVITATAAGPGGTRLRRSVDPGKDQSYVLAVLTAAQLDRAMFPLGGSTKVQVRQEAAERGLPVARVSDQFRSPWRGKFARDNFHPSQDGYRDWSRALLSAIA